MRVVSNTAASLDGRIATARYDHVAIGSVDDRRYMSVLRAAADAVLVGGRTFRNWPLPLVPDPAAIEALRGRGLPGVPAEVPARTWWNVVVTRSLDLPDAPRFWTDPRVRPLVFSAVDGPCPGEVVVGDTSAVTVHAALAARGVRTLLLECGGDLLFQWLEAGLVDELHVTLCPIVLGGRGAPTLADGVGFTFPAAPRFSLAEATRVGDELFLHYVRR